MHSGVIALDGGIELREMVFQVNDIKLEKISNGDAVHVLSEAAQKPGLVICFSSVYIVISHITFSY